MAESPQSLNSEEVDILSQLGPIDALYVEEDGSLKVIHNVMLAILVSKVETASWLMLMKNLSNDHVPNLIAYRYGLFPGFSTVLKTSNNELILIDYGKLECGIVLLFPPSEKEQVEENLFKPLKEECAVNFLEEEDQPDENPDDESSDNESLDEEAGKAAASAFVMQKFAQAMRFLTSKVPNKLPFSRVNVLEVEKNILEGAKKAQDQNPGTSEILLEVINIFQEVYKRCPSLSEGKSTLNLMSVEALRHNINFAKPYERKLATKLLETHGYMNASQAEYVVHDEAEVAMRSGFLTLAAQKALQRIASYFRNFSNDNPLSEHFFNKSDVKAWMQSLNFKDDSETGKLFFRYVENLKDLF